MLARLVRVWMNKWTRTIIIINVSCSYAAEHSLNYNNIICSIMQFVLLLNVVSTQLVFFKFLRSWSLWKVDGCRTGKHHLLNIIILTTEAMKVSGET